MKSNILKCLLVGILSLGLGSGMTYAAQREKPSDTDKGAGKTVTITGCLQKGDEAGEYSIKDENGKEYGLRSTSVKMDSHVNHKVTVTGKMVESDKEKEKGKEGHEHVDVTNLKMVSTTCQ
jgi:hypothetical protein